LGVRGLHQHRTVVTARDMDISYLHHTDAELWAEFKRGSGPAFSYIYQKYHKAIYYYGTKITSDTDLVKDAIQDLFVELWLRRDTLGETNAIKYYLYKSIRRKIIKLLVQKNKMAAEESLTEHFDIEAVLSHEMELILEQEGREQRDKVVKAMDVLTKRQKEAVFLKFYDELDYEEIAGLMSISHQAVYNIISKAIKLLKEHLLLEVCIAVIAATLA
jgi:RNA polymerase sigma factor (sigma-70 family)